MKLPAIKKAKKREHRKAKDVRMKAVITTGVLRGHSMIDIYYPRIMGLLKIEPVKGTLDLRLEKPVDMRKFATKQLNHVLMDGSTIVDAYLAPIVLHIKFKENDEEKVEDLRCWAIRQGISIYREDILEVISNVSIKDKYGLKDGDKLEIIMFQLPAKKGMAKIKEKAKYLDRYKRG